MEQNKKSAAADGDFPQPASAGVTQERTPAPAKVEIRDPEVEPTDEAGRPLPGARLATRPWAHGFLPTIQYWLETEVHVYAFSMAAMALLAFFPFLIVMVSLCRHGLEWRAGEEAIYIAILETFPRTQAGAVDDMGDFIVRNLRVNVARYGSVQIFSVLILLFAANGLFQPLEVALNRVWGVTKNRSYWMNQVISFLLVIVCGGMALGSTWMMAWAGKEGSAPSFAVKLAVIPITILTLFLIYWLLPNCRVPWKEILPVAVVVGALLEGLKWIYFLTWPYLFQKLQWQYGPFRFSVSFLLFAAFAAFLVLAGAEWTARHTQKQPKC